MRHHALGDLVTALPALRALRRSHPDWHIATTCPPWLLPLARELDVADSLVTSSDVAGHDPTAHDSIDDEMIRAAFKWDRAPDAVVALRYPHPDLVARLLECRPPLLIAYRSDDVPASASLPEFFLTDHILRRWERLLDVFGIPVQNEDLYFWMKPLRTGHTIVHPGAGSPARRWPTERWSSFARRLEQAGHHVVVTGSGAERDIAAAVVAGAGLPGERNLAGRTDILALAGLVAGARVVVSVDTGPGHLAAALRTASVALHGVVPPAWWGPPPWCERNRALWTGHVGEPYADDMEPAMSALTVEDVLAAVANLEQHDAGAR